MKSTLRSISFAVLALALLPSILSAQAPSPQQFFGFKIGDDNKLAHYDKIVEYFNAVAARSGRVRVRNVGPTTLGKPFILAEVSSASGLSTVPRHTRLSPCFLTHSIGPPSRIRTPWPTLLPMENELATNIPPHRSNV